MVVTHNRGPQTLLNTIEAGQVFREWWAYGGPKELTPKDSKLVALATPYVQATIKQKQLPEYLHGGKGVKNLLCLLEPNSPVVVIVLIPSQMTTPLGSRIMT